MKKFLLSLVTLTFFSCVMFAQDNYWYVRGNFNDYNPNGNEDWALYDDDEQSANVYSRIFELENGTVSFNVMDNNGNIYVPASAVGGPALESVAVSFTDNTFSGYIVKAEAGQDAYYWNIADWDGLLLQIFINADTNTIELNKTPKQAVGSDDLYTITGPEDGLIKITWEDYMVWPAGDEAYLENEEGVKTPLARKGRAEDYQIYLNDDEDEIPGVITVDLNNLNLSTGTYTLVITEGYVDVISEDYEYWESNPEINYEFTYEENASADPYWYVRGNFNNYNPNGNEEWALYDDDEQSANVFSKLFELENGTVSFNVMDNNGNIYVPASAVGGPALESVAVSFTDNTFSGYIVKAEAGQDAYYWNIADWDGLLLQIFINADTNTIELNKTPKQAVGSDDLYTITGPEDGLIKITWDDYMVWPAGSGAYIENEEGVKTDLARKGQAVDYQIYLNDDEDEIPGVITVDLNNLNLSAGSYTLVIPEGYVDVISEDYEYWESNPEISYQFTISRSIYNEDYNIQNFDGVISIYWDSEAISKLSYEEGEAYITDPSGEESVLDSESNLVSFFGSNPFGIEFNIKYLDLSAGKYTLTVPAKFVAIQGSTSSEVSYNPEITYEFIISETTGIDSILNIDNNAAIYNLQGVKMPNDLNKLNRGVYIINGKKVMINK